MENAYVVRSGDGMGRRRSYTGITRRHRLPMDDAGCCKRAGTRAETRWRTRIVEQVGEMDCEKCVGKAPNRLS